MSGIGEIDAQIRAEVAKRDDARTALVGAMFDIDECEQHIEDLLRQRNEAGTS